MIEPGAPRARAHASVTCRTCGRTLAELEPVWWQIVGRPRHPAARVRYSYAAWEPVCEADLPASLLWIETRPCRGCRRPMWREWTRHAFRRDFCSEPCRKRAIHAGTDRARTCDVCGDRFEGRAGARTCKPACRQRAYRARAAAVAPPPFVQPPPVNLEADHEAGKHADLEELPEGCSLCDAVLEAVTARELARQLAREKAEREADREAARTRAAWLAANPDAIAWLCAACGSEFRHEDADEGQGGLYECGSCGTTFSRAGSADGDSNRCPECGHFGAKRAELACPSCDDGELEPVGDEDADPAPVAAVEA